MDLHDDDDGGGTGADGDAEVGLLMDGGDLLVNMVVTIVVNMVVNMVEVFISFFESVCK